MHLTWNFAIQAIELYGCVKLAEIAIYIIVSLIFPEPKWMKNDPYDTLKREA